MAEYHTLTTNKRQSLPQDLHRTHLYLADKVFTDVEDILDSPDLDSCQMCLKGMQVAKAFSLQAPELVPGVLRTLCELYKFMRLDACAGLMERLGPELVGIFSEMNLESSDGYYACAYSFPGSCPVPVHEPQPITFPKPKPADAQQPAPSGEVIQVLHFSDWHVDPLYKRGMEAKCSHNICCRDFGRWNDPGPIKKPASKWGEGKCDTPIALGVNAMENIQRFVPNASFGIFTGDIVSHDSWMVTEKYIADLETESYEIFKKYLQDMKLYVVMGNHDSYPTDQAPNRLRPDSYVTHQWLYDHVASIWEKNDWISSAEADHARSHNAMFMTRPMDGLKLITLNTDMYDVRNYFTMLDTNKDDPTGMFHNLILELQDSEDRGERVWILGHMAPVTRTLPRPSVLFQRIVARYSPHVIAGIFSGHYHEDKFIVVHDPDVLEQTRESAINMVYEGPSITLLDRSNPAFRWYDIDAKTFSVLDTHTAVADVISQGAYWDEHDMEPEWNLEYSARTTYGNLDSPLDPHEPLSPGFWFDAVEKMKVDRELFSTYLEYESKSSAEATPCPTGSACEKQTLCQMQAATVIQFDACVVEEKGLRAKKKANRKAPFAKTRSGRVIRVEDYSLQRGTHDNFEYRKAALRMRKDDL
ncbi:hypothetical protein BGZ83_009207 [Gryganskiella cystojenkinii]|nr:hypothetical protein BGZ83_009207 [Gryganskiella cystojenkinii]